MNVQLVGRAEQSDAIEEPAQAERAPDLDGIVEAAQALPPASDAAIDTDFHEVAGTWGSKTVLAVPTVDLRWAIVEILCEDVRDGFRLRKIHLFSAVPCLQFSTISHFWAATGRREVSEVHTFRGYRIARRLEDTYGLYGHEAMYRRKADTPVRLLESLVQKLLVIGLTDSYLTITPGGGVQRNQAAREIGGHLYRRGGHEEMLAAHAIVSSRLGRDSASHLESAWDGVGDWLG